jgi:hypothetical protein
MGTPFQNQAIITKFLLILALLFLFIYFILFENYKVKNLKKSYLIILFLFPLLYAIRSNYLFDQSLIDGLKTNFVFFEFLIFIYIYYYFKHNKNALFTLNRSIISLAWLSFIILVPIKIIYPDLEFNLTSFDGTREYIFKSYSMSSPFIVWAAFVYLFKYNLSNKGKFLFYASLLFSFYIIFFNARIFILTLFIIMLIYYFKELKKILKLKLVVSLIVTLILFFVVSIFYSPLKIVILEKINLISQVFYNEESTDLSTKFRFIQYDNAMKLVKKHYLLGVGVLSPEKLKLVVGDYFYSSDIGLMGVIFNYGFLGLIILSYQVKIFFKILRNNMPTNNSFLMGSIFCLMFKYISSVFTASFVYKISDVFLILSIVIFGSLSLKKK